MFNFSKSVALLLLLSSAAFAAPTAAPTTEGIKDKETEAPTAIPEEATTINVQATSIETIMETVTRTVIHYVTEPATEAPVETTTEELCPCMGNVTETVTTTTTEAPVETTTEYSTEPSSDLCPCKEEKPAADSAVTMTGQMRQCTCTEADECKAESQKESKTCFATCSNNLTVFGDKIDKYAACFEENSEGITEAENCLFQDMNNYCTNSSETNMVDVPNLKEYTGFSFQPKTALEKIPSYEQNHHEIYSQFQSFYHCTKHCMHKAMHTCFEKKYCIPRMPEAKAFAEKMTECTKENYKIAYSLLRTCQCMAFENGVTKLVGKCAPIGNLNFVNNA